MPSAWVTTAFPSSASESHGDYRHSSRSIPETTWRLRVRDRDSCVLGPVTSTIIGLVSQLQPEEDLGHTSGALSQDVVWREALKPLPVSAALLLTAVTIGVVAQGAYYSSGQRVVGVALVAALGSALVVRPLRAKDLRSPLVLCCALLMLWAMIRAAVAGRLGTAQPMVALLSGLVIVFLICRRIPAKHRTSLVAGLVDLGTIAAVTGWIGVAWRISPWALEDEGLWRAATSLTYANAAAGLMTPLALLGVARLVAHRRSVPMALATCLLLTGIAACLSRAGFASLAVGVTVLMVMVGPRRVASALTGPSLGALIILGGLLPSIPATSSPKPTFAACALIAGLSLAAVTALAGTRTVRVIAAVAVVGCTFAMALGPGSAAMRPIRTFRLTLASPDRVEALQAASSVAANHPVIGVGPGAAWFSWTDVRGRHLTSRYAHNEYVQMLAELGAVGLALLLALMFAAGRCVALGRRTAPSIDQWAGGIAGLATLALHSAFDFLWHVPVIPLVGALLVGFASPSAEEG